MSQQNKNIRRWPITAIVYGAIWTIFASLARSGPDFGLAIVFVFFCGLGGWLAGTYVVEIVSSRFNRKHKAYETRLFSVALVGVFFGTAATAGFFIGLTGKTSYGLSGSLLFLFFVFMSGLLVRATTYAAAIAYAAREDRKKPI